MRAALLLLLAACERDLLENLPDAPDADAPGLDAPQACVAPSGTLPPGNHLVYLSTEGITLVKDTADDAAQNKTTLLPTATATIPPFLDGVSGRDAYIAQIIQHAQHILAPYSVDIVTTRPASGDYWLVSLGGVGNTIIPGCNGCAGIAPAACVDQPRALSLIFDNGYGMPAVVYANDIASDVATFAGLSEVALHDDCLCRTGTICANGSPAECTFGTGSPVVPGQFSCNRTTEDEPALLRERVGCR